MITGGILLPKSCVLVLKFLTNSNEFQGVSQQQILRATGLSERAVKYALKELVSRRLACSHILLDDARKKIYYAGVRK